MKLTRALLLALSMLAISAILFAACAPGEPKEEEPTQDTSSSSSEPPSPSNTNNGFDTGLGAFSAACSTLSSGALGLGIDLPDSDEGLSISPDPESDFARELGDFLQEAIEDGLSVDAEAACYYEAPDEQGTWITFDVSGSSSGTAADLQTAIVSLGGSVSPEQTIGANLQGVQFQYIQIGELPFGDGVGGFIYVAGNYAMGGAGPDYSFTGGIGGPSDSVSTPAIPPTRPPDAAVTSTPVGEIAGGTDLTGKAAELDEFLRSLLESAIGAELDVTSGGFASFGNVTSVNIEYRIDGSPSNDVIDGLTALVEEYGGSVLSSGSFSGVTALAYLDMSVLGATATGSFTVTSANPAGLVVAMQLTE